VKNTNGRTLSRGRIMTLRAAAVQHAQPEHSTPWQDRASAYRIPHEMFRKCPRTPEEPITLTPEKQLHALLQPWGDKDLSAGHPKILP